MNLRTKRYVPMSRDQDTMGPSVSPTVIVIQNGADSTGRRSIVGTGASAQRVGSLAWKIGTAARTNAILPLKTANRFSGLCVLRLFDGSPVLYMYGVLCL